jgi:heavy metal sensor kinase
VNSRSLSVRLVAWYAGVLTLVFVLLGLVIVVLLRHYLEANTLDGQARRARQIADTLLSRTGPQDEAALGKLIEDLYSPEASDRFIRITHADGTPVYVSGAPKDGGFDAALIPAAPGAAALRKVELPQGSLLLASREIAGVDGTRYRVEVGTSGAPIEATVRRVLIMLSIGLPLAVTAAVAGGFVLVRRALLPVQRITHKAEQISQHNLSERLPVVKSGDEIEQLSVSLNSMISRLEEAVLNSKQFLADASHELRTPLTVMRGELEGLAQDEALKDETRETLGSVLEEVNRLAGIVEGLLALSRLDAGEATTEWVRFDLAQLAADAADQMSLLALDKRVEVTCLQAGAVTVAGDRARLKQVVVNLLDNAIKYTPRGGRVTLEVRAENGWALLEVRDTGIGIPAAALPHVFKRFYRADDSRSRAQGGAGLGLSIVKSICAAHAAQVEVLSNPGGGSTFRVRQPLAAGALAAERKRTPVP